MQPAALFEMPGAKLPGGSCIQSQAARLESQPLLTLPGCYRAQRNLRAMETLRVALMSILGFTLCIAILYVATHARVRWRRIVLAACAALGLVLQGALWAYIMFLLKSLSVGGS